MTDPTPGDVALELERLRATVETGFARLDGALALLVQRSDQLDTRLADHEQRLDALEKNRWPVPSIVALVAVVGLAITLWQAAAANPRPLPCHPAGRGRFCRSAAHSLPVALHTPATPWVPSGV